MSPEMVMQISHQAMKVALMLAAPVLLTALAVGLVVSLFQAATQINEMTLSFIPKILAVLAVLVLAGPTMGTLMVDYMRELFTNLPYFIGA